MYKQKENNWFAYNLESFIKTKMKLLKKLTFYYTCNMSVLEKDFANCLATGPEPPPTPVIFSEGKSLEKN